MSRLALSLFFLVFVACTSEGSLPPGAGDISRPAAWSDPAFASTFREDVAEVNGVQLHYVVGGQGTPVVLLHGYPETWYQWRHVMAKLAERHTVLVPDLRGLGESSRPEAGYDLRTLAEDIHQLARQQGFQRYSLAGHDWGGAVAYVLAATYPAEVSHLSVIDVVPPGAGLEQAIAQPNVGKLWFFHFMSAEGMPEVLTAGKEREYLSYFYDNFAARREALTAEAVDEYVRHYSSPGGMSAGFAYYRAFMQDVAQVQELVKTKLPMPTLGVGGDKSFGAGVEYFLRAVADDVRGAVLPDTGHFVAEEQPEELSRLLLELFSR